MQDTQSVDQAPRRRPVVSFRLRGDLIDRLEKIAALRGISRAAVCESVCTNYIENVYREAA